MKYVYQWFAIFAIPEAIFDTRAFTFDTNVVVNITFDIISDFC